jgi:hypothetical protein
MTRRNGRATGLDGRRAALLARLRVRGPSAAGRLPPCSGVPVMSSARLLEPG